MTNNFRSFITAPSLPGAHFDSHEALLQNVHHRIVYEDACQMFEKDGNACAFRDTLEDLGSYDSDEIATQIAAAPGYRLQELFA